MPDTENSIENSGIPEITMQIAASPSSSLSMQVNAGNTIQAPIDSTLTLSGQAADAKATGDRIRAAESGIASLEAEVPGKVSKPATSPDGTSGQLLRTNGDGTTTWVNQGLPTDAQTATAVSSWLDEHAATAGYVMTVTNHKLVFTEPASGGEET